MNKIELPLGEAQIIVYGAGIAGKRVLLSLSERRIKNKVIVWDRNYAEIEEAYGYAVSKPDFENFSDKNVQVIIAIDPKKNADAAENIRKKFEENDFNNFVNFEDVADCYKHKYEIISKRDLENHSVGHSDLQYQDNIDFSDFTPKVKMIAFYLPQFHDIPENDKWWGKGFTEWTNLRKAKPYWKGHYQPREPHDDLGYYDLTDVETIRKQAKIAKQHGIYGWCIYYYWFSGKRLLERPLDILLNHKDIDINFCLYWANESWTKQWIGDDDVTICKQEYLQDDPEKFINDMKKYFDDSRYIRLNGKPVIHIYKYFLVPDLKNMIERWRAQARKIGIGELCILINCNKFSLEELNLASTVNGALYFSWYEPFRKLFSYKFEDNGGSILNYAKYVDAYLNFVKRSNRFKYFYRSSFALFDNSPRYSIEQPSFFCTEFEFSLRKFYKFVRANVDEAVEMKKEFTFIFSWNEWCEGSYIEPDKKYGYAVINTLSKAIYGLPFDYSDL